MLDLLLDFDDLPRGWRQYQEVRIHAGVVRNELGDKRVAAIRMFVQPRASSYLLATAMPALTQEDAFAKIADTRWIEAPSATSLQGRLTDMTDVTPPPEAGEHARALLATLNVEERVPQRWQAVAWAEPEQPIVAAIVFVGPAGLDGSELMSGLVQRQRMRLVRGTPTPDQF